MKWLERLLNKQQESTDNVKTKEAACCDNACQPEWCVERYKDGKWQQFGKCYKYMDDAISALVDWSHMYVGEEFRVSKTKRC